MTSIRPPQSADHLTDVVMNNIGALIRSAEYGSIADARSYLAELQKDIKCLSEVLTCLHFSEPTHPLAPALLDRIRPIILHRHMLQAVRLNPILANWLLDAVALLQDHFAVTRERDFALALVDHFGLDTLDAPAYRREENRYLFAKLKGEKYTPIIDRTYERNFYRLSRDQVYALTHLLFYVSDYGTSRYQCPMELSFALEHLIIDSYLNSDVDVMLELMLVYRACERSDEELVALFEGLLVKRIASSPELRHAMTEMNSEHFPSQYHQCLLAVLYNAGRARFDTPRPNVATYRSLRRAHDFHASLRSPNYVTAARKFTGLAGLASTRLKFCRDNLDRYLALQRLDI